MKTRLGLIAIVIVLTAIIVVSWQLFTNRANVELILSPSVATPTLNNSRTVKEGKFYLEPGSYDLSVAMDGFSEQKIKFDVSESKTTRLTIILIPNSAAGLKWLNDHPEEALRRESLVGGDYSASQNKAEEGLPLVKELPFIDRLYRVDYGPSKNSSAKTGALAIYVTYYTEEGKNQAISWLKFKGYDPAKTEIIYEEAIGE